ncbi:MAG: GDPmannose 4,6-dehydratase [Pseudonocardiales bacterium]|jgi:GDPmannose 4,6-dehydratase|nr:GDPmannose 4,6-dehydratase [Pseudonocardiales bacterium]
MRALVTGVTGQDGWYLADLLTGRGDEVFGFVAPGEETNLPPRVTPLMGDLRNADSIRAALEGSAPDQVYNLAAVSSVAVSWRDPELVADVNGVGVLRLLNALRDSETETGRRTRFVQASSAEIFGAAAAPQNEETPIAPLTPYGAAKAFAHHCVGVYRAAGMWASNVILFNHESPRRPPEFVTRKITQAVSRIAAGGTERLSLGNLDARRDWGYALDYVTAMTMVAAQEDPDDFVIATGVSHSIADFVAAAFARVGITDWRAWVESDSTLRRSTDAAEQRGDASRAREILGWEPSVDFDGLVTLMVDADLIR